MVDRIVEENAQGERMKREFESILRDQIMHGLKATVKLLGFIFMYHWKSLTSLKPE